MPPRKRSTRTRSRSTAANTRTRGPSPIKHKMTKAQLIGFLTEYLDNNNQAAANMSSRDVKRLVTDTIDGLTEAMERSICPRSVGEFMFPRLFKVTLRAKKAIRKGTMVRSPATGEMVPSKGRPASKVVKIRPLVHLKKAAAGEAA